MDRKKRVILIADSSASFIFYTSMLLKKLEYSVRTSSTVDEALRTAAATTPALVITDTILPPTSGLELLKRLKASAGLGFIPVVMHSSQNDVALREACMNAGCSAFLAKLAEPESLFRAIQAATESTPRRHIRINVQLQARINAAGPGTGSGVEVTTLSEGGLFIRTDTPAPVKTVLPIELRLRNRDIAMSAVVLYTPSGPGKGMGMRFESIRPDDVDTIRAFIHEQVLKDLG